MTGSKKKLDTLIHKSTKERVEMIEKDNSRLPVTRQAELLSVPRSNVYYKKRIKEEDEKYKKLIKEIHEKNLFYGVRKIARKLRRDGHKINRKRVWRLMREMGIKAIFPKPRTTFSNAQHKKYPYLLKDVKITKVNQVWSSDITYIRIKGGWIYLTVIMDWYSRHVISWEISITLEDDFCITALRRALRKTKPEIFNSDQGVQYTSKDFTSILEGNKIKISMDGKGRCYDNIFTERLWRTVKYENVYLKDYETVHEAYQDLKEYFEYYNNERLHQSLDYKTPAEVYENR